MNHQLTREKGLIAWFASNPVAANLLFLLIIASGIASSLTIRKQTTPDFDLNAINIGVPYPGAAPQEVEAGVIRKVEEAVQDTPGLNRIVSTAFEGRAAVTLEISRDADINQVLSEVKTRVDAIISFPEQAERPSVYKLEQPVAVSFIALSGDMDAFASKELAYKLRDSLMTLPEVSNVEILGDRDYEISIEVSENTLREYGLSMGDVSDAIKTGALDLPSGMLNTTSGDILLRTTGQVYEGPDFADLVLRSFADGTRLTLGDIATINDGFVETDGFSRFNRKPSATLRVLTGEQQNELATSRVVRDFIEQQRNLMPEGVKLDIWVESANYLRGRLDMMLKNMLQGAILVFVLLSLFLRLKFALWVIIGIPFSFLGALTFMPVNPWPVTVNVISLFGFILVLGIVVDDAIIIGESIYTKTRADGHTLNNVIRGTHRVATTATFGVLTTVAAFAPLLFVNGMFTPYLEAISVVVCLCLIFSLIESKLILPAHLAHARIEPVDEEQIYAPFSQTPLWHWPAHALRRAQFSVQQALQWFVQSVYRPLLVKAINARGVTMSIFLAMLIITAGFIGSGIARVVLFPKVPGNYVRMDLAMQEGTAPAQRSVVLDEIEDSLYASVDQYARDNPSDINPIRYVATFTGGNSDGSIVVELPQSEDRPLNNEEVSELWRSNLPDLPGVRRIAFSDASNLGGGAPINIGLSGNNEKELLAAAKDLEARLAEYDGLYGITNDSNAGGEEIQLTIKPAAEALGITLQSLATQVRHAFYGEEAQRIQRGRDELKVMVRYPQSERLSVADLRNMNVRTPGGESVPFESVAQLTFARAFSSINRVDRRRTITVSSDADLEVAEPVKIVDGLYVDFIPDLLARYPSVSAKRQGSSEQEQELLDIFKIGSVAALILIYALIAIPLKSYAQPLLIMAVIPFGLIGAVAGHIITGNSISLFSIFGLIALSGVVVNDSLIMVDFINTARRRGTDVVSAVIESGTARFRAIILTSLTTAVGLLPILSEKSVQAQFVIPMAVSLSFGILFATVITLFLIPALYVWHLDVKGRVVQLSNLLLGRSENLTEPR